MDISRKLIGSIVAIIVIVIAVSIVVSSNRQDRDDGMESAMPVPAAQMDERSVPEATIPGQDTNAGSGTDAPAATQAPKPATVPSPGIYTMAQVETHASGSSCWTVVNGNVYDVTAWISKHPGGRGAIMGMCGRDASAAFDGQHGGQRRPEAELANYKIGVLAR